jgi:hypothetical protein
MEQKGHGWRRASLTGVARVAEPVEMRNVSDEARGMAAVHPNVALVYQVDAADGRQFIAMELIKGRTYPRRRVAGSRGEPAVNRSR